MTGGFAIAKRSVSWRRDRAGIAPGASTVERNSSKRAQAPWVVPDHSVLLEKIIQNQVMPQLLDFGHVDDHLCRTLAAMVFSGPAQKHLSWRSAFARNA